MQRPAPIPEPVLFPDPLYDAIDAPTLGDELGGLLLALDGVAQDRRFHPEGDALFHSLQVFDRARARTGDRALWAAALLHDVGKAQGGSCHAEDGADRLEGLVAPRIVWLVRHHLDLLRDPRGARRRLGPGRALADLELLRRCDEEGRSPWARVLDPDEAIGLLMDDPAAIFADAPNDRVKAHGEDPR